MRYLFFFLFIMMTACEESTSYVWNGKDVKIALLPMGNIEGRHALQAKTILEQTYQCQVIILPNVHLPDSAWYAPRSRYRAEVLIHGLSDTLQHYDRVIGITDKDIAIGEGSRNWGVFGYGAMPGRGCVISTFRLKKDPRKLEKRFQKVVIHEAGHTFGLDHCESGSTTCFMRDAKGKILTIDQEKTVLCETCKSQLGALVR